MTKVNALSFTGTFSKSPLSYGLPHNLKIIRANGSKITLNNGKTYTDWASGLGSNLLGYGSYNRKFHKALSDAIEFYGGSLSLPHQLEYEVAEKISNLLQSNIPHWKDKDIQIRFAKTGSDVTTMAIRLSRAVTGKANILCVKGGYHGWGAWTTGRTQPSHGITREEISNVIEFEWNNLEDLENRSYGKEIAAVIIEHPLSYTDPDFYEGIRKFCDNRKCLLIMDEVVTGLRYGLGGVSGLHKIKPDLICMGKALGNGYPISVLAGDKEYMNWFSRIDPVFCSSTFWGEAFGLTAANAVLDQWNNETVERIHKTGKIILTGLNSTGWKTIGDYPRSLVIFGGSEYDQVRHSFFVQEMFNEGVLINRPNFATLAHKSEEINELLDSARLVRTKWDEGLNRVGLDGMKNRVVEIRRLFSNR